MPRINLRPNGMVWDVQEKRFVQRERKVALTGREIQVLVAVAQGYSTKEIAKRLGKSFKTVESQRSMVKKKLGIASDARLGVYALASGFIDADGNDMTMTRQAQQQLADEQAA